MTETDIFAAITSGDAAAVERVLDAAPSQATARNDGGISALMMACYMRNAPIRDLLVRRVGALDVFEAASAGDVKRLAALIAGDPALAAAYSPDGFTALHYAAFFGQPAAVKTLVAGGAPVLAYTRNDMANQPLHAAAAAANIEICRALVAAGADVNAKQHGGFTPLHEAAHLGNVEMVELFLEHGADRSTLNDEGKTALDLAAEHGFDEVAAKLR